MEILWSYVGWFWGEKRRFGGSEMDWFGWLGDEKIPRMSEAGEVGSVSITECNA